MTSAACDVTERRSRFRLFVVAMVAFVGVLAASCSASSTTTAGPAAAPDAAVPSETPALPPGDDDEGSSSTALSFDVSGSSSVSSDGSGGDARLIDGTPAEPDRTLDTGIGPDAIAAHVNGLVPEGATLGFEWQALELETDHVVNILAPVGWDNPNGDRLRSDDFGFWTQFVVDTGCQGVCGPQDWSVIMQDPSVSPFATTATAEELILLVDQELSDPAGRLVVYELPGSAFAVVRIEMVRWQNEADRYFECEVDLDEADRALWPAFADVCLSAVPTWFQ